MPVARARVSGFTLLHFCSSVSRVVTLGVSLSLLKFCTNELSIEFGARGGWGGGYSFYIFFYYMHLFYTDKSERFPNLPVSPTVNAEVRVKGEPELFSVLF